MRIFLLGLILSAVAACTPKSQLDSAQAQRLPLILSPSLETSRAQLQQSVDSAREIVRAFAEENGWQAHTRDEFMDSVMILDDKLMFNQTLLKLLQEDTTTALPETYCAALEKRILITMSPAFYAQVYPEGKEAHSFSMLLAHEMAHRLHIRILGGNEEAMGPIWFFEGFAIYAAGQLTHVDMSLTNEELIQIIKDPDRGSYLNYSILFRRLVGLVPISELVQRAGQPGFNDEMILALRSK